MRRQQILDTGGWRPATTSSTRQQQPAPAQVLTAFSGRLRDEPDLSALTGDMVQVVQDALQPVHVSICLRPDAVSERRGHRTGGR